MHNNNKEGKKLLGKRKARTSEETLETLRNILKNNSISPAWINTHLRVIGFVIAGDIRAGKKFAVKSALERLFGNKCNQLKKDKKFWSFEHVFNNFSDEFGHFRCVEICEEVEDYPDALFIYIPMSEQSVVEEVFTTKPLRVCFSDNQFSDAMIVETTHDIDEAVYKSHDIAREVELLEHVVNTVPEGAEYTITGPVCWQLVHLNLPRGDARFLELA